MSSCILSANKAAQCSLVLALKRFCQCRGFAFLAYQDQRSTVLAVDNLNGAIVSGRTIRVEHVDNYRKKKAEVRPVHVVRLCRCQHVLEAMEG